MVMWRPSEPVEDDDVGHFAGIEAPKRNRRSRRLPWRDGLAAQTVIADLEDTRSYRAFERAIVGSVSPRCVLELELALLLANLLWRLRRVSAIETGLFEIHGEDAAEPRALSPKAIDSQGPNVPRGPNGHTRVPPPNGRYASANAREPPFQPSQRGPVSSSRTVAERFLRLSTLHPGLLDRVGGYEARLWRQAAQTIWTLEAVRRPPPTTRRPYRKPAGHLYWDAAR
jgi:hypothetical protein